MLIKKCKSTLPLQPKSILHLHIDACQAHSWTISVGTLSLCLHLTSSFVTSLLAKLTALCTCTAIAVFARFPLKPKFSAFALPSTRHYNTYRPVSLASTLPAHNTQSDYFGVLRVRFPSTS